MITTHYNDCDPCTGTRAKRKGRGEDKVLNNERCVRIMLFSLISIKEGNPLYGVKM